MQVLRVCRFSTFALPPAFPPGSCPLAFQRQVRRLTSRMSSESYPGYPECVVSCHGAGGLTNSIRPLLVHETRGAMVTAKRVQKLSPSMNVELVGGQEVFRQHADGMAPQAQLLPGMLRPQSGSRPGPQGPSHIWLPRVEAWSQTPEVQRET